MEQLGSNERPDNVIEIWCTKAWEIVEKADKGQLIQEDFLRLFAELGKLHPDPQTQELFSLFAEAIPQWQESDKSTFRQFRGLIIETLEEVLKEA